jgi:nucleoside-diphosphate kinase
MQRTLVLIKPDAFKRKLVSKVIGRLEDKGLDIVGLKYWFPVPREKVVLNYERDKFKPYFEEYCDYMCSGPVISITYQGVNAVNAVRTVQGNYQIAGSIRGDYASFNEENLIHASDSQENAEREINIWFSSEEL